MESVEKVFHTVVVIWKEVREEVMEAGRIMFMTLGQVFILERYGGIRA